MLKYRFIIAFTGVDASNLLTISAVCGITRGMIDINDITVRIGSKVLLEQASAHISDGWKVGLVGANGCGKSTLFRVLQNQLDTEHGSVAYPNAARIVFVEQELRDIEMPVLQFVLARDTERAALLARLDTAAPEELGEIHERLNLIGAASAEARAAEILNGLGFTQEDLARPVREFSGGWRMRLALAAALFQPSDILLLDEPTNHLDLEASVWLTAHLSKYRGTLLLISHDRRILNTLCDHIVHIEACRLNTYNGNYDTFQRTRAERRELLSKQAAKQEKQRAHLQSYVDRFRYKASKAKQAQSRIKMLEKMEVLPPLADEYATRFEFPRPIDLPPPLLTVTGGVTGYDGSPVLKRLNFSIVDNDRIALLGANGNGKSTLAKLISGRLPLMEGTLQRSGKLNIGYFAQHQGEELPLEQTAAAYMASLMPATPEPKVRAHLAAFGLSQEKAVTKIADLSGGEKARLLFAAMTYNAPGLLILDEPTNHLDIDGRDALIAALNEYSGSVILITHDLHLIELIADTLWLVKDGTVKPYDGDLEDYRRLLLGPPAPKAADTAPKPDGKLLREQALARRSELNMLKGQVARLEKKLAELNTRREELTVSFAGELTAAQIIEAQKNLSWLDNQIAETEEAWLEQSAKIETLSH